MVGYRHFDTNQVQPEYEFGFGLSYSEFVYRNLEREDLKLTFEVENISAEDGDEIVQVYLSAPRMHGSAIRKRNSKHSGVSP